MTYLSSALPRARRTAAPSLAAVAVGLFVAGVLISAFSMRNGIDPFDEGLMLQAARRVSAGQVPYRDFLWAYGPAQPYLMALLSKLFGVSLLHWRIVRVLADAGIALAAYLLVSERVPRPLALAVWLAVACEISEPRSADPFPLALLAALLAVLVAAGGDPTGRRLLSAAVLTAAGAAFRLDFALYGLAAAAVTFAAGAETGRRGRLSPAERLRPAVVFGVLAVALCGLVYLPFAIADGPASLYQALIGTSLHTHAYWTLPFPLHFHRPAGAGVAKTAKKALDFYVPLLVVIGVAVAAAGTLGAWWRERRPPALLLGLLVLGAGLFAYMFSRADEFHVQSLFVVVTVALAVVGGMARSWRSWAAAPLVIVGLLLLHGVANRLSALVGPQSATTLHIPVADGVEAPPAEARAIVRMVALVDARVPPGRPIYVLPRRSDLVTYNDPLIYVMTERDNPTRQDFGLQTGAAAQAQIVSMLTRVRPLAIVRWTDPASSDPEPNLRGRSSGVHTVDDWVAGHYRVLARLYHYTVLVPVTPR